MRRYQRSVERMGRRGVHFVGRVSDQELVSYYRSADILCSPAVGHESQGYVLLEAMAAGAPVVASNIDGYASVVTHRVDGLLARPKDSFALADALTALVRDPRARARLAAAGRCAGDALRGQGRRRRPSFGLSAFHQAAAGPSAR